MNTLHDQLVNASDDKANLLHLVGFVIGTKNFGVDILMVQEILRNADVTKIPDQPDFIEGVINLRGRIVPVIDLRKRLKFQDATEIKEQGWMMILNIGGRVAGFTVDRVTSVMKLPAQSFSLPPDLLVAGLRNQYIQGVCKVSNGLVIILDFNQILMIEEIIRLKDLNRQKTSLQIEA